MKRDESLNVKEKLRQIIENLSAFSDGLDESVYVVDPDTHEVLFANKKTKELFGEDIIGKKCHKIFSNLDHPCPSCTNKYVFGENIGKIYTHDYQDEKTKRWYRITCKAIRWLKNKYVKYGISIDITEQKKMEKALMESERQHRVLVEAAPDVIYSVSSDGRIISLNPAFEKITGWKCEEWIGKPFTEIIHPEDVTKAVESFQKTLDGKPEPVELRVRCMSGDYLVGEFISVPLIEDGRTVGELGIARDITTRKMYEDNLQSISTTLQTLIQAIPDIVYFKDVERRNLIVNSAFERLVGLKRKEIIGKRDEELFPPDLAAQCRKSDEEVLQKGVAVRTEECTTDKKSGRRFFETIKVPIYDNQGKVAGLIGISRDMTERKLVEEKLREREELFRSVVENSHNAILLIDENFKIIYANDEVVSLSGYPKEGIIGQDFRNFLDEESRILVEERYIRRQRGEPVPIRYEFKIVRKDGEKRDVEIKAAAIRDKSGKVLSIAQLLDITERKRFEERLSALNKYGQSLNMAKSMGEIYRLTLDAMEKTLGFEFADIFIIEGKMLCLKANRGYSKKLSLKLPLDGDEGVTVKVVRTKKSIFVPDVRKEKAFVGKGTKDALSELAVPIKVGKTVLGVLNVESKKLSAFNKDDMKLLEILASHAATAISNLKRRERLSALNEYGKNLNAAKSIDEIYKLTLDAMKKTLGFEYASILMVKGEKLCLVARRGYSKIPSLKLPLDKDKGITVIVARKGQSLIVPDVTKEKAYVKGGEGIRSELAVPIKVEDKVIGVLNVESKKIAAFDEEDKKLLETLASHAATAIKNLKRQETLSALNEYGRNLNTADNLEEICKLTLDAMEKILGFEFATFFIVEGKELRLIAHRGYPKKLNIRLPLEGNKGVSVKATKEGKPIFVPDVRKEKAYVQGRPGMLSELAVPIKIRNKVLGVLNVESKRLAAFDNESKELLETLASHAATAMSNLKRRERLMTLSQKITNLMKSSTEIMNVKDMYQRLKVIAKTIQNFGWRRVVIGRVDENLERKELITVGLTKEEIKLLKERRASGHVWKERLGPKFEKYKIGEFYYIPWRDPWARENFFHVPPDMPTEEAIKHMRAVPSRLSEEDMVDWHPQDMLYAPLRTPEGRIVGILSMDDPVDGRKPTRESLIPLELFLHQAAITIENAQLIEDLREARKQLETYALQLEQKVEERTRELKKSQEQLLKAQRLAVIGELAGMVGHDLRNPLTSIAGAQYYLKKRLSLEANEKLKEMLDLIERNITYSNKIINDLLDYSREIELEYSESTPKLLVKEALRLVEIPKNVQVSDLTENKPKIKVDAEKMRRVFVNLIKNAVDAMPKGGKITIKSIVKGENLEMTFSDTGVGMTKETLEKLWTPLFTTKAKGMGFGLAICKRFVDAHGGSISVKSAPRKGATFTVTIPIQPKIKEGGEKIWIKPPESLLLTTTKT